MPSLRFKGPWVHAVLACGHQGAAVRREDGAPHAPAGAVHVPEVLGPEPNLAAPDSQEPVVRGDGQPATVGRECYPGDHATIGHPTTAVIILEDDLLVLPRRQVPRAAPRAGPKVIKLAFQSSPLFPI